jgi:MoaA/NifB/PqqE/SkfB family radical SAM enzyme
MQSVQPTDAGTETGRRTTVIINRLRTSGRVCRRALEPLASQWIPFRRPANLEVFVDITNRCNLRCVMCHFAYDHVRRRRAHHMDPAFFRTIATQLRPHTRKITLSAACEPTVSPHFSEILRICGRLGFPEIGFLTNGHRLSDAIITSILDSAVTQVAISLHGATSSTYSSIHRGGSLQKVLQNAARLLQARGRPAPGKPRVGFHVTLMRRNIRELPDIVRLAAELGVDFISMRHLVPFQGLGLEPELLSHIPEEANAWIQRALELAHQQGIIVPTCPDYFPAAPADSRAQVAWWLPEPRCKPKHFTLAERSIPMVGRLRALAAFLYRQRRFLPVLLWGIPRGHPVGSLTGLAQTLDGDRLILQGWALSRDGIERIRLIRTGAARFSQSTSVSQDAEILAEGQFHNGADPSVQALFDGFPLTYRSCWSIELNPQDLRLQGGELLRVEALTVDGTNRSIVEFRLARTPSQIKPICTKPFASLYIDHLGQVYPHPDCRTPEPFGSFADQRFVDIWSGAALSATRTALTSGRPPAMCRHCPLFANRNVEVDGYWETRSHIDRTENGVVSTSLPREGRTAQRQK